MRRPDWQSRLHVFLLSCEGRKFGYSGPQPFNCGTFAAGVIEALTGIDITSEIPSYTDHKSARQALRQVSGSASMAGLAEHFAAVYGFNEIPVAFAQRGDVVQVGEGMKSRLATIAPHGTELLAPGKVGLIRIPRDKALRAWSIK